jgi:hypothetical protein
MKLCHPGRREAASRDRVTFFTFLRSRLCGFASGRDNAASCEASLEGCPLKHYLSRRAPLARDTDAG